MSSRVASRSVLLLVRCDAAYMASAQGVFGGVAGLFAAPVIGARNGGIGGAARGVVAGVMCRAGCHALHGVFASLPNSNPHAM